MESMDAVSYLFPRKESDGLESLCGTCFLLKLSETEMQRKEEVGVSVADAEDKMSLMVL
jgi:hypothetical protein